MADDNDLGSVPTHMHINIVQNTFRTLILKLDCPGLNLICSLTAQNKSFNLYKSHFLSL